MTKVILNSPRAGEVRYVRDAQAAYLIGSGSASLPAAPVPAVVPVHPPSVNYVPVINTAAKVTAAADAARAHAPAAVAHPEIATDAVNPKKI